MELIDAAYPLLAGGCCGRGMAQGRPAADWQLQCRGEQHTSHVSLPCCDGAAPACAAPPRRMAPGVLAFRPCEPRHARRCWTCRRCGHH